MRTYKDGGSVRALTALALVLVALLAGGLATPGNARAGTNLPELGAPHDVVFGFNDDWGLNGYRLFYAAGAGGDTIRFPISWAVVEGQRGTYDWAQYDQLYAQSLVLGIRLILTPQDSPCWAHRSLGCAVAGGARPDPEFVDEFAEFVRRAVERYPELVAVEVWNEPNLAPYYLPGPEPAAYARLLRAAHGAVESVRPELPVVFGGMASVRESIPGDRMSYLAFLRRANAAGAEGHYDGVAIHSYAGLRGTRVILDEIRRQLVRTTGSASDLWLTEIGYSSAEDGGESGQATRLVRMYETLRRVARVRAVIVHRMFDAPGSARWDRMGLVRRDGTLKQAFCAVSAMRGLGC